MQPYGCLPAALAFAILPLPAGVPVPARLSATMSKPTSIEQYLSGVSPEKRAALESLRAQIHALQPGLDECISYSMPAFRLGKHVLAGFLATKAGCSYYPFSGTTLGTLAADLKGYSQTKSALHFTPDRPLPKALIKKLLATRRAECEAKG